MKKIFVIGLVVMLIAAACVVPVMAMGADEVCDPADPTCVALVEPSPPASTNPSLPDVAVLIAIVAFFKKRFGLSEKGVIYTVLGVGAVLWFSPLLAAAFPDAGKWIDQGLSFVKWVLASMGAVDFTINTGAKIVTTTKKDLAGEGK